MAGIEENGETIKQYAGIRDIGNKLDDADRMEPVSLIVDGNHEFYAPLKRDSLNVSRVI